MTKEATRHPVEQALLAFFRQVAEKDAGQLERLRRESRFRMEPASWYFTLPDLYLFLRSEAEVFQRVDYREFRKALFSSPVNRMVKTLGAEIVIVDNRGKVDQSGYALVWKSP